MELPSFSFWQLQRRIQAAQIAGGFVYVLMFVIVDHATLGTTFILIPGGSMRTKGFVKVLAGIVLAVVLLMAFSIQLAFATNDLSAQFLLTPTPASTREACEDNGGELVDLPMNKHSCEYFPPYRPYGKIGASTNGNHSKDNVASETSIFRLSGERYIYAIFPFASCPQQCTISATLPRAAANDLPAEKLPKVSVRLVEIGGAPGTNVYWVCFDSHAVLNPAVYRYLEGSWVRITDPRSGNPFCTFVSSGGSFFLGDG
jgi:hypothetical protein